MGKAARVLKNNRNNLDNEDVNDDEDGNNREYTRETSADEEITKTAYLIQTELFDYVNTEAQPLCEFLSIKGVENYIKFVLSRNRS